MVYKKNLVKGRKYLGLSYNIKFLKILEFVEENKFFGYSGKVPLFKVTFGKDLGQITPARLSDMHELNEKKRHFIFKIIFKELPDYYAQ